MKKTEHRSTTRTAHRSTEVEHYVALSDLAMFIEDWIADGESRRLSSQTLYARRYLLEKLVWFLKETKKEECGTSEIRAFLAYVNKGHSDAGGRWGNVRMTKAVRPRTTHTYFTNLRTFFWFLVAEGNLGGSPMERLRPPVVRDDQIKPFTPEQLSALLVAAKGSKNWRRDTAILLFLYDTGARASELCSLKVKDFDLHERCCTVQGKGNKTRSLPFGVETRKALWNYLRDEPHEEGDPFFLADRGTEAGNALTRSGLLQLVERIGKAAGIQGVRCSPHTFRHTFAIEFLRNGGEAFTLKELLGHTNLTMTNKYVLLAQADLKRQHRQFSPADRLKRG